MSYYNSALSERQEFTHNDVNISPEKEEWKKHLDPVRHLLLSPERSGSSVGKCDSRDERSESSIGKCDSRDERSESSIGKCDSRDERKTTLPSEHSLSFSRVSSNHRNTKHGQRRPRDIKKLSERQDHMTEVSQDPRTTSFISRAQSLTHLNQIHVTRKRGQESINHRRQMEQSAFNRTFQSMEQLHGRNFEDAIDKGEKGFVQNQSNSSGYQQVRHHLANRKKGTSMENGNQAPINETPTKTPDNFSKSKLTHGLHYSNNGTDDRPNLKNRRGGQRAPKPPENSNLPLNDCTSASSPLCEQTVCLYIRIHAVVRDIETLGKILTDKANIPGIEFTPTDTTMTFSESFTFCTLTFSNKTSAKMVKKSFLKDRETFVPLIDCSFTDYDREKYLQKRLQERQLLEKQVLIEFDKNSAKVLHDHSDKCDAVQKKIDEATERYFASRDDSDQTYLTSTEIAALEEKLQELNSQKEEYLLTLQGFKEKLSVMIKRETFENDIRDLRMQFGIECCRLKNPLPMYARRRDIITLVKDNQVSVILGETGSGKSTQMVQYLLEAGFADNGMIVCTQPRKVAAISLATHVAAELASNVGKVVGYTVGSKCKCSTSTKIVFMTDHSLLNECLVDPDLMKFSCIVVDEAHERSLNTDLLLGMIKRCLPRRPDLRVIVTSATIEPDVFVNFFGNVGKCPVMKVSGRTFPVDVIWQDVESEEGDFENYLNEVVEKVTEIHLKEPAGDILAFVTTPLETEKCCDLLQQKLKNRRDFQCFPLHGQLQSDEQQKVFTPLGSNTRKVVFATNCAETSITIDGIKYVVDTGLAKEMRYDAKRNMNSLNVSIISRSSAEQRKGRAGRTAPGKCYRLYSERSFKAMDKTSPPEILRTHLGSALLKLAELGIGPDKYDFVESPSQDAIKMALESLVLIGAIAVGQITDIGRWIAKLPFDPKLGFLTLMGKENEILYDSIVLAAIISAGGGIFYRGNGPENLKKCDKSKTKFSHSGGDHLTALTVYKEWQDVPEKGKNKWCMQNSINAKVLKGVRETVNDILQVLKKELKFEITRTFSTDITSDTLLRKIIFRCHITNLCHYLGVERAGYFAARVSKQVHMHPSSCMHSLAFIPEWVVYDQLIQTSRDFITGITPVEESWLAEFSSHNLGFDFEDARRKEVLNVFTQPAGLHAFFALVGPSYGNLRKYEEMLADTNSVVVVEASRESGEIKVFSTEPMVESLKNVLEETVQTAVEELKNDDMELPLGKEDAGLRVVLGQGGQVIEILMPNQTRKAYITRPSQDASEETICEKFREFNIKFCKQFIGGRNWGFVIFKTADCATLAARETKDDDCNVAELERRRPVKTNADFKAHLMWCRRECRGFGFADVCPTVLSECLTKVCFFVDGNLVKIKKGKKDDTLHLSNITGDMTEDMIKWSLLNELGFSDNDSNDIVKRVTIVRVKVDATTENDRKKLQKDLKSMIQEHLHFSNVEVNVVMPRPEAVWFHANAFFTDPIEGIAFCKKFKNHFYLSGKQVKIEPTISARIVVQKRIMQVCKQQVEALVDTLKAKDVEMQMEQQRDGNYLVKIQAPDIEDTITARTYLNDVIKGDTLDANVSPNLKHLMTSAGRRYIQEAEKRTNAHVLVDNRLRTISIHGSEAACTTMRIEINKFLDEVLSGTVAEVLLKGPRKPPGLMKALITKYGDDLENLITETGLYGITIDYRRHTLKLLGLPDNIQKAKDVFTQVEEDVWKASEKRKTDEDTIDCNACLCPIETDDLYRLEVCAHPYCRGCLKHQVSVAITNRSLPIVCCQEDCGQPWAWRDVNNLVRRGDVKLPELVQAAASAYVQVNKDTARFCLTPDCPMVYRVSNEDCAEVFLCPQCGVRTCTACHVQAHDGVTCAMLRSSRNEKEDIMLWVKEDPKRRKACPGCNSPIEKTEGCNKMLCAACKTIFCWICCMKFKDRKLCYDHLVKQHGSIYPLDDPLYQ